MLAGLAGAPGHAQTPALQGTCRTFEETRQQVCGRFLEYWTLNGGLAQQGYPISAAAQERSDTDGKVYTTQYFERAVFEHHPENALPYDVLLSLLGVFEYDRRYGGSPAPGQRPSADNSLLFGETGKTIGGRFRQYWEANGGLPQQGYPISDEFQERSDLDGKTYTVQYFQRAVFEYHPENAQPYDVLLSHLGRFRYDRKHGSTPPPGATPTAPATTGPAPTPNPTSTAAPGLPGQLRPGQGRWTARTAARIDRGEVAVAEANGKIYVMGGLRAFAGSQATNEEYDSSTDTWRARAPLPRALDHAGAAAVNGKVYLVGGYAGGDPAANAYEYDPAADTWRPVASMLTPRAAMGVAVLDGKIYAVGGANRQGDAGAAEVYDPDANTWTDLAALPTPREHLAAVALGGKIYAVGGRHGMGSNIATNEEYDPATNSWRTRAPLPTARSGIAAAALANHMLVFGGEDVDQGRVFSQNEAYDPATDTWIVLAPMLTARHGIGAAVVGGVVYVPNGGGTGGSFNRTLEAFTLNE
jgi:N-acetylneuraminic acid mutarotase